MPDPRVPETYTVRDVAQWLGVTTRWVHQQCRHTWPHLRDSHGIRFTRRQLHEIEELLEHEPLPPLRRHHPQQL